MSQRYKYVYVFDGVPLAVYDDPAEAIARFRDKITSIVKYAQLAPGASMGFKALSTTPEGLTQLLTEGYMLRGTDDKGYKYCLSRAAFVETKVQA